MNKDIISQTIVKLFDSERFYAEIILSMRRILSNRVPIAGVRIKDKIELFINEKTFSELSLAERVAVLKHECEHILRDHIPRFKTFFTQEDPQKQEDNIILNAQFKVINIAMDCAINTHIKDIPEFAVKPAQFDLHDGETAEWYFENLKHNEKIKNSCNEFDSHELWAESDEQKEILREKIRQMINKAAEKTRAAGKMSSNDELLVSKLNASLINWKDQLKNFVAAQIECLIETSRKKRNRRYGIMYPGSIKVEKLHLGVAIDTSGSVSDESLVQFMSEIDKISKYATITVVEADSEIKNHYLYDSKKKYAIKGRGGTAYKPVFDFFNQSKDIDGLIYFGDMDTSDEGELIKPNYPVLWAIVGESNSPASFGKKIYII